MAHQPKPKPACHVWSRAGLPGKDDCALCAATCTRDDRGVLSLYTRPCPGMNTAMVTNG